MPTVRFDFSISDSYNSLIALLRRAGNFSKGKSLTLDLRDCSYLGPLAASIFVLLREKRKESSKATHLVLPAHPHARAYCQFSNLSAHFERGDWRTVHIPRTSASR